MPDEDLRNDQGTEPGAGTGEPDPPPDTTTPDGTFPCFALRCHETFSTMKERMHHGRPQIMDLDHCAEYLHCFAPCRNKEEDTGICYYAREATTKPNELGTHLREKVPGPKRCHGVERHKHLSD
ncbi:hypothetical protein F5X68DRAFT_229308 [Plectosphaerella plurivora]|uniref:Uncharacterized protein n=1 Tax=Plectosphaerella plurivora TaxID=936078 RepID=A0A9P8VGX4_9PEZI|nr:hypothetical protein F5X68DRAFT_229308 [Plectosphaerella plurivora]